MSDIRRRILDDIRGALRRQGPLDDANAQALTERMAHRSHATADSPSTAADDVRLFQARSIESGAELTEVTQLADVPAAVAAVCDSWQVAPHFVASGDVLLARIDWPADFKLHYRVAGRDDKVALTGVLCGIAETGSLVMRSSSHTPSTLNFLPENHIAIMQSAQITPRLEHAWSRVYDEAGRLPRAVNLISGPSKTADVEQTLQHGAHGPRRLHIVLVTDTDDVETLPQQ